jgi:hypothetical protein
MAELDTAPNGAEEPVVAPAEDEAAPPKTVEDFARERGWKPKEEYQGDEAEWREPEQFLRYRMDRNSDLLKKVAGLQDTTERMARTQAQITQDAVDRARLQERQQWEHRHTRAVEEGDLPTATRAVQRIAELANPAPVAQPSDPSVEAFVADNVWFTADPIAQSVALAASEVVAKRGGTVPEQLKAAREAVHKRFPEYAPSAAKPAPSLAQPGARAVDTRNRKKGFSDMPADAQQVCRELEKRGHATRDGYVANYFNEGAS